MKVFVTAMECEAEAVVRNLSNAVESSLCGRRVVRGTLCGTDTAVVVAGVGKANAASGTQLAISSLGAAAIINVGVAGGLDPEPSVGAVYRASRAVVHINCYQTTTMIDINIIPHSTAVSCCRHGSVIGCQNWRTSRRCHIHTIMKSIPS